MSIRPELLAAAAALLLVAAAPPPVGGRCGPAHAEGVSARAAADAATARGDHRGANRRLGAALRALGDRYASNDVIDDSGTRLILAERADKAGRPQQAAALRRRVLSSRLDMCLMATPGR